MKHEIVCNGLKDPHEQRSQTCHLVGADEVRAADGPCGILAKIKGFPSELEVLEETAFAQKETVSSRSMLSAPTALGKFTCGFRDCYTNKKIANVLCCMQITR